ncbi:MAG: alanine racemase, partial [Aigarchaeota archaeon]|nr:alanine racemase [Aigarchaeota archaeon]
MRTEELDTPALLLDLDALERNISKMSRFFRNASADLRPHVKTHKCPEIAQRQIDAGAKGITCAKLGEAEVMAQFGVD